MKRIFRIGLNIDDMCAALDVLDGDHEMAEWMRGFRSGARGAKSTWKDGSPGAQGYQLGKDSLDEAAHFQAAKSEAGKISAASRLEKCGSAIPVNATNRKPNTAPNTAPNTSATNHPNTGPNGNRTIEISIKPIIQEAVSGVSTEDPHPFGTTATAELLTKPDPTATIPRRLNLGDLKARHLVLLVSRTDEDQARTLVDLYGWETCSASLTALEPVARARPPGKQRVMVSEFGQYLEKNFELEPADYKRAGLPIPEGLSHG